MSSILKSNLYLRLKRLLRVLLPVVGVLLIFSLLGSGEHRHEKELKRYATVPTFSLTERSGRMITNHDLAGKIYVADFIFTTCAGPCPIISSNMVKLQQKLAGDRRVQLVSFTVNPRDDTPEVLSAYANRLGADPQHWWFLTGPEKAVYDLIQKGFLQTVQDNHDKHLESGEFLVMHSTYVVLVDGQGCMRGFFNGLDDGAQVSLLDAIHRLEKE